MKPYFQHAIITGGSSGIGKAFASLLVQEGSNLTLVARDLNKLNEARQELLNQRQSENQRIVVISSDVSDPHHVDHVIVTAVAANGVPDLLITSAGIAIPDYFNKLPLEIFKETMDINYLGTVNYVRTVAPLMQKQKRGQIIMISSIAGILGVFGYSAYSPTKFAIRGFAEAIRSELILDKVYVSVVYPPDTDTPQLKKENLTKPLETKLISGTLKTWSAKEVAMNALAAAKKHTFNIIPGFNNKILFLLHNLLRPMIVAYFDYIIKRTKRRTAAGAVKNSFK